MAQSTRGTLFKDPTLSVDPKTIRAYQAAIDALHSENWDGVVMACGKAIEGIARTELPYNERGGTLGQLVEKLPKHVKLEQPMSDFAAALKDPKTLGALFDLETPTDQEVAQATLDVLETFISYVYIFRTKVQNLKSIVERQAEAPTSSTETDTTLEAEVFEPITDPVTGFESQTAKTGDDWS